ncbi:MAG: O-antigen ligase C-terminal domain-containing protein [Burkholderiales bacterium]|nr:O-antigen ligase C-terminal domain-containing protein [Burkholderiales bacterium]
MFPPLMLSSIGLVLALCWSLPFNLVWHTYPISTFYAESLAFFLWAVLVGLLVIAVGQRDRQLLQPPRAVLAPLGFIAVLMLQLWLLPLTQPLMVVIGVLYGLAMITAMHAGFWASRLGWRAVLMRWSAYALVAGGLFSVFCLFVQAARLEAHFSWVVAQFTGVQERRLFANMYQPNHVATYLSFGCAATLYLWHLRRIRWPVWLLTTLLLCAGQALTVSRTPWVQVVVIAAFGLWLGRDEFQPRRVPPRRAARWLVPLSLPVMLAVATQGVLWLNDRFAWQLAGTAIERFGEHSQIVGRLAIWRYALAIFFRHPWLGGGWGEFINQQFLLADHLGSVEMANNAHNVVLDVLAKTGLIGALLILVPLLFWLWRALRSTCDAPGVFALLLIGVLSVHAMLEYPQQYAFFLLPVMFLIGFTEPRTLLRVKPDITWGFHVGVVISAMAVLGYLYQDYQRVEVAYEAGRIEAYRQHPARFFTSYGDYAVTESLVLDSNQLDAKIAAHRQALTLGASNVLIERYVVLLALAGRDESALLNVARLKSLAGAAFAMEYRNLLRLCRAQGDRLQPFVRQLEQRYGTPPSAKRSSAAPG